MIFALGAVALGIVLGLAVGGSFGGLARAKLRFEWMIVVLFLLQGLARGRIVGAPLPWALGIWTAASIGLIVLLAVNYKIPGLLVASLGTLLNLDATLLNFGMPVFFQVPDSAVGAAIRRSGGLYAALDGSTKWAPLGDVFRLSVGAQTVLLSTGDVLLIVGICVAIVAFMSPRSGTE